MGDEEEDFRRIEDDTYTPTPERREVRPGDAGRYLARIMNMRYQPRSPTYALDLNLLRSNNARVQARRDAARARPGGELRALLGAPVSGKKITLGQLNKLLAESESDAGRMSRDLKAQKASEALRSSNRLASRRLAGAYASTTDLAAYGGQLLGEHFGRKLVESLERNARLRTNRRGAAASRAFQPIGNTNRTGANAQPITIPGIESAREPAAKPASTTTKPPARPAGQLPARSDSVVVSESQRSKDARAIMGREVILPAPKAAATSVRASAALLSTYPRASQAFVRAPAVVARRVPRPAALPRATARELVTGASPTTALLTGFNAGGVGFPRDPCDCTKRKKPSKPRCVNPVVSRITEGNIRTTKVRVQCPSSKPK